MLFKRKKPPKPGGVEGNSRQDRLARAIAGRILGWQEKAALWLNRSFARLPLRARKALLLLFCLLLGTASGFILLQALWPKERQTAAFFQKLLPEERAGRVPPDTLQGKDTNLLQTPKITQP